MKRYSSIFSLFVLLFVSAAGIDFSFSQESPEAARRNRPFPRNREGGREGRSGREGRRNVPPPPTGAQGTAEPGATVDMKTALGQGTVPELIDPPGKDSLQVAPIDTSSVPRPVVPEKVLRFATLVFERYDSNADGALQRDEWSKMSGVPQSIDLNGDFEISLDEWVRFVAVYGSVRSLHRPNPPRMVPRSTTQENSFSVFHPLSTPPLTEKTTPDPTATSTESPNETPQTPLDENQAFGETPSETPSESDEKKEEEKDKPQTGEEQATENEPEPDVEADQLLYEKIVAEKFRGTERKYYVPATELRGVPLWFITKDKNGDGQISMVEFDPMLTPASLAAFAKLDKNNDGLLTADEVRKTVK